MRTLYHFTSQQLIKAVLAQGLTRGMVPWDIDPQTLEVRCKHNCQWLTAESSYEQPWALLGSLPFARNRFRITVMIPPPVLPRLMAWPEICRQLCPESAAGLNACPGWADWYVFRGHIPPSWFLTVERNPYGPAEQMRGDFAKLQPR